MVLGFEEIPISLYPCGHSCVLGWFKSSLMIPYLHDHSGIIPAIHMTQLRRVIGVGNNVHRHWILCQVATMRRCVESNRLVGYAISVTVDLSNTHLVGG